MRTKPRIHRSFDNIERRKEGHGLYETGWGMKQLGWMGTLKATFLGAVGMFSIHKEYCMGFEAGFLTIFAAFIL